MEKKLHFILLLVLVVPFTMRAQSFSETITKELSFEKKSVDNAVLVANINGDIRVTGYEGDKVVLEVTRKITGKTPERLEKGKKEIQLGVMNLADTLIFFVEGGCNNFGRANGRRGNHSDNLAGWGYNWNDCNNCNDCNGRSNNCRTEYDYEMDFVVKVPTGVSVLLSTINNGDVSVGGMKSSIRANNINGSIRLTHVVSSVSASTINGDVDIDFDHNPDKASRFYTLNGDINANFQKGLGANLSFESFNGSLYTNIAQLESLPVALEKEKHGDGMKYKINGNHFKVGKGGVLLDFETFNGDAFVKEKN